MTTQVYEAYPLHTPVLCKTEIETEALDTKRLMEESVFKKAKTVCKVRTTRTVCWAASGNPMLSMWQHQLQQLQQLPLQQLQE